MAEIQADLSKENHLYRPSQVTDHSMPPPSHGEVSGPYPPTSLGRGGPETQQRSYSDLVQSWSSVQVVTQPGTFSSLQLAAQDVPNNFMALSVFACLCCCFPLGLVAIYFSDASTGSSQRGDYVEAKAYSRKAIIASIASMFFGAVIITVAVVVNVVVLTPTQSTQG